MSLPVPTLDDLDFERLVEDARGLIPRYAPEWTDHNLHDPGITLLELLAWIVDQQIYQIGFVGDRHLRAFAALLGARPRAAVPARGLIWPHESAVAAEADLLRGTRVTCVQQPAVPFELDADIHLTPARRQAAKARTGAGSVDLSAFLRRSRSSYAFQSGTLETPAELEMVFDRPLLQQTDKTPPYPIALGIEVDPPPSARTNSPTPWGPLVFEYRIGETSVWRVVERVQDGTFALARTGVVLLYIPPALPEAGHKPSSLRLRLDRGFFPIPPRIVRIELNVLPIVQLETVPAGAFERRSNGMPDQAFELNLEHLPDQTNTEYPRRLSIEVEEKGGFEEWKPCQELTQPFEEWKRCQEPTQPCEDLTQYGPEDRVYRLETGQGRIVFGNGVNGRIPPEGAQIRYQPYHLTRAKGGNLTSRLGWRVAGAPIQGNDYGTNPLPLDGGDDAWGTQELIKAARASALKRKVLLSDEDLRRAVESLEGYGVARAEVLPHFHPRLSERDVRGARSLVVVPWRDAEAGPPRPVADQYVKAVAEAVAPWRVLGESLSVIAVRTVIVRIEADLLIAEGANTEAVRQAAEARLRARLSDLAVTEDIPPWPLGRPVTCSEIKALLAAVPQIIAVPVCLLAREDSEFGQAPIKLLRDEVAIGGHHDLQLIPLTER